MEIPQITAKTIISNYSEHGWFGTNYTMNIYKGCSHGCIYCDSRSECYGIVDFDTVKAKENALEIISRDLASKRKKGTVITGSMSDPYNPAEESAELTRGALKLIDYHGFGICIDTKSTLVLRDIDILSRINNHAPVFVNFTVTTADDDLCGKIERDVALTSERIRAIKQLTANNITCGILLMPILPFINDDERNILKIIEMGHEAGVSWIYAGDNFAVSLRQNQREHFYRKLDKEFPGVKKLYIDRYGNSYWCGTPNRNLFQFFKSECRKRGILYDMNEIVKFLKSDETEQITFDF